MRCALLSSSASDPFSTSCPLTLAQVDLGRISPWLLRFELDREAMSDKNMSLEDITRKIEEVYDANTLHVICNDDNAEKLVMRVRLVNDAVEKGQAVPDDIEASHFRV